MAKLDGNFGLNRPAGAGKTAISGITNSHRISSNSQRLAKAFPD
jgi:hypothetical protein